MPPKLPIPQWIPPQLTQLVETAPSGSKWLHEIKLDGFRMAGRIERGQAKLLTRTGLDWSAKYLSLLAALAAVRAKTTYLDGELCGVGADGLPNFADTQAATDGARGVRLVFYAFDLLHLDGRDTAALPLVERKALLEPIVADIPGLQFNGHEIGDGELGFRIRLRPLTHSLSPGPAATQPKQLDCIEIRGPRSFFAFSSRRDLPFRGLLRSCSLPPGDTPRAGVDRPFRRRRGLSCCSLLEGGVKVTEARRHAARSPSRERRSMPRERATRPRQQSVSACRLAS
jgi:hypothetical protein